MAQVAVNKDGSEVIGDNLFRAIYLKKKYYNLVEISDKIDGYFWCDIFNDSQLGAMNASITLPKGTIKKLIGRELTWEDEPVELK